MGDVRGRGPIDETLDAPTLQAVQYDVSCISGVSPVDAYGQVPASDGGDLWPE